MNLVAAEQDLYRACEVIFGPELDLSRDFLHYIQLSGVKSAYRKRALETHPDRFLALEDAANELRSGVLFHDVRQAYENLLNFLQAREKGLYLFASSKSGGRPPRPPAPSRRGRPVHNPEGQGRNGDGGNGRSSADPGGFTRDDHCRRPDGPGFSAGQRKARDSRPDNGNPFCGPYWSLEALYRGPLPNRRLLLGHFLYYSGIASWRTIVQALIWQRSNRPKIGEISRRFGILDQAAVDLILKNCNRRQLFGESALKLGLLDEYQLQLLIRAQRRAQRRFGEYFVEQGLLEPQQLARLLTEYHEHNRRLAREFAGRRP